MNTTNKVLIALTVVIVAILAYRYYQKKAVPAVTTAVQTTPADTLPAPVEATLIAQRSSRMPVPAMRWN